MSEDLKPCPNPWCSSHEGPVVPFTADEVWQLDDNYRVQCPDCRLEGPQANSEDKAIAAWNNRPSPANGEG